MKEYCYRLILTFQRGGISALHVAAAWNSAESIQILLDHGAHIEARDENVPFCELLLV